MAGPTPDVTDVRMVALMFTDIEGSTGLWERHPEAMRTTIARHDQIVDGTIARHGGTVIDHAGDGVFAVFTAGDPLGCCLEIQREIQDQDWGLLGELRVRIGVHAGRVSGDAADFRGPLANRAARVAAAGWGGQILFTPAVQAAFPTPDGVSVEDLGVHELKGCTGLQPILQLSHPALALTSFPALRSLSSAPNNLPAQSSAFIGRERDLAHLRTRLRDPRCRVLTIVGPGGMGKTRLAIQSAREQLESFPGGVYLAALAAIDSPDLVISAIAKAIELHFYGSEDPRAQLLRHLRGRRVLLILDNFEHLLGASELVTALVTALPKLTVLATSRERLDVRAEEIYALDGMQYPTSASADPGAGFGAVELFVDRAHKLDPGFRLGRDQEPYVIEICRMVSGLPLAIELAAAWTRVLSCREIADEIARSVDFLESSQRDRPERHRSIRAVLEHSWALLGNDERAVFCRLSAFKGGFSRDAAVRVARAGLHHLATLVDKSLVRRDGQMFSIHELLRQLGAEKLGEDPAEHDRTRTAHCEFFTSFVHDRRSALRGRAVRQAAEEILAALDNVRQAWSWALERGRLDALEVCLDAMITLFETRSELQDGEAFFDATARALATMPPPPEAARPQHQRLLGMARAARGLFLIYLGRYQQGIEVVAQSLPTLRAAAWSEGIGFALHTLAAGEQGLGDYESAAAHLEQSIAELGQVDDPYRATHSRISLGQLYAWRGQGNEARALYEASIRACDASGDVWAKMIGQLLLAEIMIDRGESEHASAMLEESLAFMRTLKDWRWVISCLVNLGRVALQAADYDRARALYQEGLELAIKLSDPRRQTLCLTALGRIANRDGASDKALGLLIDALWVARASRSIPEILDILLELARSFEAARKPDLAARLIAMVRAHPGSKRTTLDAALRFASGPEPGPGGLVPVGDGELDRLVQALLSESDGIGAPAVEVGSGQPR